MQYSSSPSPSLFLFPFFNRGVFSSDDRAALNPDSFSPLPPHLSTKDQEPTKTRAPFHSLFPPFLSPSFSLSMAKCCRKSRRRRLFISFFFQDECGKASGVRPARGTLLPTPFPLFFFFFFFGKISKSRLHRKIQGLNEHSLPSLSFFSSI